MIGFGTIVNTIVIIICSLLGIAFKHLLNERHKNLLITAVGLSTLILGLAGVLSGVLYVEDGVIQTRYLLEIIVMLALGSLLGALIKVSNQLDCFSYLIQEKFSKGNTQFAQGFVSATLIFSIGAMAIMGAIRDGMAQDATILYSKSILDGITALILASSLGVGVLFSAIPVFLYQMTITIIAFYFGNFLPEETKLLMNIIGNILIIGISFNVLELKKVNVADMLPSIFLPILYTLIRMAL